MSDPTDAIRASLFAPEAPQRYLAHLQTFEPDPPGPPKVRFLLISAHRQTGVLSLHKAKQNANNTFSIGKTWNLSQLEGVQVTKIPYEKNQVPQPLQFTLVINGKQYTYLTRPPTSTQAAFLVTMVRCWRRYHDDLQKPYTDLNLSGFGVDGLSGSTLIVPKKRQEQPTPSRVQPGARDRPGMNRGLSGQGQATPARSPVPGSAAQFASSPAVTPTSAKSLYAQRPTPQSLASQRSLGANNAPMPAVLSPGGQSAQAGGRAPRSPMMASHADGFYSAGQGPAEWNRSDIPRSEPVAASRSDIPPVRNEIPSVGSDIPPVRSEIPPVRSDNPSTAQKMTQKSTAIPTATPISSGAEARALAAADAFGKTSSARGVHSNEEGNSRGLEGAPAGATSRATSPTSPLADSQPTPQPPPTSAPSSSTALPSALASFQKQTSSALASFQKQASHVIAASRLRAQKSTAGPPVPAAPDSAPRHLADDEVAADDIPAPETPENLEDPEVPLPPLPPPAATDTDALLNNIEEMLQGLEWAHGTSGGAADVERQLVAELRALDGAYVHAMTESDDRVPAVLKGLDDVSAELEKLDLLIGLYRSQLALMSDEIAAIEGHDQGLQVQTANQRVLLAEVDRVIAAVNIPASELRVLSETSLEGSAGIARLEAAASSLYKALLSLAPGGTGSAKAEASRKASSAKNELATVPGLAGEVAALATKGGATATVASASSSDPRILYAHTAQHFAKRLGDYLGVLFQYQAAEVRRAQRGAFYPSHQSLEDELGRFCGLMMFVKEAVPSRFSEIGVGYIDTMAGVYKGEIAAILAGEAGEAGSEAPDLSPALRQQSLRKAANVLAMGKRVGSEAGAASASGPKSSAKAVSPRATLSAALFPLTPHILRELAFLRDFLNLPEPAERGAGALSFADYMQLDTIFRRGAARGLTAANAAAPELRTALERIFAGIEPEVRAWGEGVCARDALRALGLMVVVEEATPGNEDAPGADDPAPSSSPYLAFLARAYGRLFSRFAALAGAAVTDQLRRIDDTRVTLKRRRGIVPFVSAFPDFARRVEAALGDTQRAPRTRAAVDAHYTTLSARLFDALQQLAKRLQGEGAGAAAGKDQLNYHVILIENMFYLRGELSGGKRGPGEFAGAGALGTIAATAAERFAHHRALYIKIVLRRPFSRPIDFFFALEERLQSTPPAEVAVHQAYTRAAAKRAVVDIRPKELRKAIDTLYKRVEKHFLEHETADRAVLASVWAACEAETVRMLQAWRALIVKCYPKDKGLIEATADDVKECFARAKA